MKKILIVLLFVFLAVVPHASAHTYVFDGDITVLMHIDPNDAPVAGGASTIHFGVTDSKNHFKASNCTCTISISENGNKILEKPVLAFRNNESLYNAYLPYIFPEAGVYTIMLSGTPKENNLFQSFSTSFDIRIDKSVAKPVVSTFISPQIMLSFIVLVAVATVLLLVHQVLQSNKKK